ncbi:MAG: hypothetical protein QOJ79_2787 [Actinomycetota bacterium]|nr:hypothetical protein [Actinomycetota bacterium]
MHAVKPLRAAAASALTAMSVVLLTAGPALADRNPLGPSEGADPGSGLSPAATIALFVFVPLAIIGAIATLVLLPGMVRGTRYRPAMGWDAPPVWFAGPLDPEAAVSTAQPGDVTRGGSSGSW